MNKFEAAFYGYMDTSEMDEIELMLWKFGGVLEKLELL